MLPAALGVRRKRRLVPCDLHGSGAYSLAEAREGSGR